MAAGSLVQGAIFTVMVVRAGMLRDPAFTEELAGQVQRSPRFFQNAPVILDLKSAEGFVNAAEFAEAKKTLREHTLSLIGVQNAEPEQLTAAVETGLASFAPTAAQPTARRAERALADETASANAEPPRPSILSSPILAPSSAEPPRMAGRLVTQPVRSGTQIYAKGTDLVVTAPVSPGAELVADGNIHVYAPLRGRALAGAGGDTNARIFCSRFEAELVSIAGRYLVSEQMPQEFRGLQVQVTLVDDRLTITKN